MTFMRGDRVRLSPLGISRILPEIIKGRLPPPMRRRSCNNRKLTDMSVGTVTGFGRQRYTWLLVIVTWDEIKTPYSLAAVFVEKIA